tara:strand:+ start:25 stop:831 length:807 start_codon:yes stop_codon:yes gene_type:complete
MKIPFFSNLGKSKMVIHMISGTDVGLKRKQNQDCCFPLPGSVETSDNNPLMVVADGMGGLASGEIASKTAVDSISSELLNDSTDLESINEKGLLNLLGRCLEKANQEICDLGDENLRGGMGTTCTLGLVAKNKLYLAHIGDSRAYLYREGILTQVTQDHSLIEEQLSAGYITEEEADNHPKKNIITRALGIDREISPQIDTLDLQAGDKLLFCSDGLHGLVPDAEISDLLSKENITHTVGSLISRANDLGGDDNIAVIVGHVLPVTNK